MASYDFPMDPKTLWRKLQIPLIEKDYGNSAAEILQTCALAAEYAQEHTPDQVKAFQERVQINPQVWLRLLALHRDERLKKYLDKLPASYTALYAIHRMRDDELETAIQQGVIHADVSSHAVLAWTKEIRAMSGGELAPYKCLITFGRQIDKREFIAMKLRMNAIAAEYDAELVGTNDYIPPDWERINKKTGLLKQVEGELRELLRPLFFSLLESDRNRMGLDTVGDLIDLPVRDYTGVIGMAKQRIGASKQHGKEYVLKLVAEYLKTDSRSQRFNYKRRLKELQAKEPGLSAEINQITKRFMQ